MADQDKDNKAAPPEEDLAAQLAEIEAAISVGKKILGPAEEEAVKTAEETAVTAEQPLSPVPSSPPPKPVEIFLREDGVYAAIPAALAGTVDLATIHRELSRRKIENVDIKALQALLEATDGLPVKIAERRPDTVKDARAVITLSPDEMYAYLEIEPALGGKTLERKDIEAALAAAGVTYGIDWERVEAALAEQDSPTRHIIAQGKPPVDGRDAYIDYRFNIEKERRPVELEDGRVDFYNIQMVQNVTPGQVLAVKIPAQEGVPGLTVTGKAVPPKGGKDVHLPKGKNTEISEDGMQLVATVAGQVVKAGEKIHVLPIYEVHGDVDFTTGNIDFVGSVVVQGNVKSGFTIRAQGNIEIRGSVEAATLIADGDVIIQRGMQGGDRGQIMAGRNIVARFLEHAQAQAGEEVRVEEAIMYSQIQAGKKIEVTGKRGRIVGGLLRAGDLVRAKVIGSKLATKTEIEVGLRPEIREELGKVKAALAEKEKQLDQLNKALNTLKNALAGGKVFTPEEKARLQKIITTHAIYRDEVLGLRRRKEQLEGYITGDVRGRVEATETIYPGVKITIGQASYLVKDEVAKALFYLQDGEVRQGTSMR